MTYVIKIEIPVPKGLTEEDLETYLDDLYSAQAEVQQLLYSALMRWDQLQEANGKQ
jgi:hypothetical protein